MERNIIAWSVPNMVTIPLMAFIGFLVVGVVWQLVGHAAMAGQAGGGASTNTAGAY